MEKKRLNRWQSVALHLVLATLFSFVLVVLLGRWLIDDLTWTDALFISAGAQLGGLVVGQIADRLSGRFRRTSRDATASATWGPWVAGRSRQD
jgi:hypothetical protein